MNPVASTTPGPLPVLEHSRLCNEVTKSQRILIVADDERQREHIRGALEERGFSVTTAADGAKANEELLKSNFDLLVMSLTRADDGAELTQQIRSKPELANTLLLVLAEWGTGGATLGLTEGADAFEPTPIEKSRLISSIERMLHQQAVVAERGS